MVSPNKEARAWQEAYDNIFRENEKLRRDLEDTKELLSEAQLSLFTRIFRKVKAWVKGGKK